MGALNRRTFEGKLFSRYHSYGKKTQANNVAKQLREQGFKARVVKEKNGLKDAPFTVYHRKGAYADRYHYDPVPRPKSKRPTKNYDWDAMLGRKKK